MTNIDDLRVAIAAFVRERDWDQFHTPKNLAMGLAIEAAEVLELFQWLTEAESRTLNMEQLTCLREEIGDVQLYLINLAGKFELDPLECASAKLMINKVKYPAEQVRGSARKYSEY